MRPKRLLLRALATTVVMLVSVAALASAPVLPVLRVCADSNNLPFSNRRGQGLENKLAQRLARALGARVEYTWWAQRRGFLRNTLTAGRCDVVMGVPSTFDAVASTRPYYRSTYMFVTDARRPAVSSFDDPALRVLRVGIPLVGDDGTNPAPELALARRGIVDNVIGYSVYGDYAQPDPPLDLMRALMRGELDVAVVWGPVAGFFVRRHAAQLSLRPVVPAVMPAAGPGPQENLTFAFDIAVGVRRGDLRLRDRLDRALRDEHDYVERILNEYGVPRI
jgi:mxaJ protein